MKMVEKLTVREAVGLMDRGERSSAELVTELAGVIRECDKKLNAYISMDEEYALKQARQADAARARGEKGKLLGVPVAVKDILNVRGQPCTCASRILEGYVAPYDATVIALLRKEGAVFLGRTNMDEFAMGCSTENSAFGITRNPCNTDYVPGGSSGGSAAAVAGGEALIALGSDTGGSVRQPASFCGCVGLKPSYGRVSRYGLVAFASSLDQVGPLTRDVYDAALILGVMAGHDEKDSTSVNLPVPDYTQMLAGGLKGMKLGLPREYFVDGMDEDVRNAVLKAVDRCRELGADIIDVSLPHTEYAIATYYIIAAAEASANLARFDGVRYGFRNRDAEDVLDMYGKTREQGFGPEVKRRIILGTYVLSGGYYDAYYQYGQKTRTLIRKDFEEAFSKCSAILTPTAPSAAFRIGEKVSDPLRMYLGDVFTATANLAGICGISVPCGFTADNLPVGLQILGPAFKEENILRVAYSYEQSVK